MPNRLKLAHLIIPIAVLMALSCGPCGLLSGASPTPPHRIAVSTEAAGQLEARIQENLSSPTGQPFILRLSDAELTSLLTTELAKTPDAPVKNPLVWFTKGKLYGTGTLINVLPIEANFSLVASVEVQDDKLIVKIDQFSAGAIPIPRSVLNMLSQTINQTVDELQLEVTVTDLEILEGEAIITGVRK